MAPRSLPDLFRPVSQVDPIRGRGHSLHSQSVQGVEKGRLLVSGVCEWRLGVWANGERVGKRSL